jgi:FAD dependent oxidoreductase TIGR03364
MALRSREVWLQLLRQAELPSHPTGSLHLAYREDEAEVAREFCEKGPELGYECVFLTARETLARTSAARAEGLLGALWSPTEVNVDSGLVLRELPRFLTDRYGVEFHFGTAVTRVGDSWLEAGEQRFFAASIVVAGGDEFQLLFPECFVDPKLTRCKLQMMRTGPQPGGFQLGPALAFGLSFAHYPTFEVCGTLQALRSRILKETPELDRWGIHVMVSQTARGELTIGDSHEYGAEVSFYDKPLINDLILNYAKTYLRVPSLEIATTWHGVYAKHPEKAYVRAQPTQGTRVITVTSGIGMTLAFGLAEETFGVAPTPQDNRRASSEG